MPGSQTSSPDGSWAAMQEGPGILGHSIGKGGAAGLGRVVERVLVLK